MGGISHNTSPQLRPPLHPTQADDDPSGAVLSHEQMEIQRLAKIRTDALLLDLWRRKLPMVRDHLRLLQRAQETLASSSLTPPLRAEAAVAAHKLAGSLGMFGHYDGTRLARELENLLDSEDIPPLLVFARLLHQLTLSLNL